jgi:cation diffusion facilitator CzcD-associated flavoprotein CzcO
LAQKQPRIAIIGAGISGILVGIKLSERGLTDYTIYEKAETLGGTWRDNRYPGIACDVPSHLYVYSFAHNPDWTHRYATGPDIQAHYSKVADQYGVSSHIRCNSEVASAEWTGRDWTLTMKGGETISADILISAVGRLHHPKLPDIKGLDSFTGQAFHSARWPKGLGIDGKRIGIIGTGSSATQMTAAIAGKAEKLSLFQRTPQWVIAVPNPKIEGWRRWLFRLWPSAMNTYYDKLEQEIIALTAGFLEGDTSAVQAFAQAGLDTVRDPELKAKLTPNYKAGCKRLVLSPDFHQAVQHPQVELVDTSIDHVAPQGIVTSDGRLHELDVLVLATGFKVDAFMRPMTMTGENGVTLDEVWADTPMNYRSLMIPHMPNFFMINGPYSPGGSSAIPGIIEVQTAYMMKCIDRLLARGVALTPSPARSAELIAELRERAKKTIWATGGCKSWYLDKDGVPIYNPVSLPELKQQLAEPAFDDFVEVPIPTNEPVAA